MAARTEKALRRALSYAYGHTHDGAVWRWLIERDEHVRADAVRKWQQDRKLGNRVAQMIQRLKRFFAA